MTRPLRALVHMNRSGQVAQLAPKRAWSCLFNPTVTPAGQVTVRLSVSMSKSSRLNPPLTAVGRGGGSMTACLSSSSRWARSSPLP